jgi:hypothetical protein
MIQRTPVFYANITGKLANPGATDALVNEFGPVVRAMPTPTPSVNLP